VKTTVNLDDDLYRRAVSESVRRYGNTRSLSTVINELLRSAFSKGAEKDSEKGLMPLFGLLKDSKNKLSAQELKDLARQGWD